MLRSVPAQYLDGLVRGMDVVGVGGGGGGGRGLFFFNDAATTEIYTRSLVGSVRCV